MPGAAAPAGPVPRAVAILRQLATARQPMPLSRIADATALPKSTVHRILVALAASGATVCTTAGHTLSREWVDLLRPASSPQHAGLRHLLIPHLVDLHRATGLACDLAVRDGVDVVFLACIHGHDYRPDLRQLPDRVPAHCTAAGQVLLAFDPAGSDGVSKQPLAALTARTITEPRRLHHRLARIRTDGVAVSRGERVPGTVGLAAAVTGRAGTTACALSVGGPADQVEVGPAAAELRQVAHAASVTLRSLPPRAATVPHMRGGMVV